jgi:hypothetical protein
VALAACGLRLAGALPAAPDALPPGPPRGGGLRLRGGGLFFGRKQAFVPRFEPPPAYSPPAPRDSAWTDVKVCLAAIVRLVWRTVRWLCRLVVRLLLRVLFAAASVLAGVAGWARRSTGVSASARARRPMALAHPAPADSVDLDWFGETLSVGYSDTTSAAVGGTGEGLACEPGDETGKATLLPACAASPPQWRGVPEAARDSWASGEDRPVRVEHHAARWQGASRQRRCGVALPEQLWERRAAEALAAAQEQAADSSSATHSLSALLPSESAASSADSCPGHEEGKGGMGAGQTPQPAAKTPQRASQGSLAKTREPFTPSHKFFMPSPFAAFAGQQAARNAAPGADGPIADLLTRGALGRDSALHAAALRDPASEGEGRERETGGGGGGHGGRSSWGREGKKEERRGGGRERAREK